MIPPELRDGLDRFVADTVGSSARVAELVESDGHAGLTYLFDLVEEGGARRGFAIKLAPKGVTRRGNTDVFRQAPLLRALHRDGQPVPDVPWAYEENPWFEVPFVVMERLPGRVFFVWDPLPLHARDPAACERRWLQCAEALAQLHAFDWRRELPDWEAPISLEREITRWERIYAKAPEPAWIAAAEATERALLASLPDGEPVGLFHGDYQPGNCLYEGERFTGIIDWELSGIGGQLLDVGWLMMVADPHNWTPAWHPVHPLEPARIRAIYERGAGRRYETIPWHQALAGYRLACIACLNVRLHRKGQRHDPIWEHNARSVLPMFERAQALIA